MLSERGQSRRGSGRQPTCIPSYFYTWGGGGTGLCGFLKEKHWEPQLQTEGIKGGGGRIVKNTEEWENVFLPEHKSKEF